MSSYTRLVDADIPLHTWIDVRAWQQAKARGDPFPVTPDPEPVSVRDTAAITEREQRLADINRRLEQKEQQTSCHPRRWPAVASRR